MSQRLIRSLFALLLATSLTGCGYNEFQRLDEQVKAGWAEVLNQYQRRADLVPNLVATVKGEANFEQETLQGHQHPGHPGADQRPGGVPEIPGRAG